MSSQIITSDPICVNDNLYATIEIDKNTKSIQKLQDKYFKTHQNGSDKYVIFKKHVNFKCKTNGKQFCNVIAIECFICYDEQLCSKNETEDLLYFLHPSLGKGYIASKLSIVYKPKKNDIILQPIFFRELAKYFKTLQFDPICIKELQLHADYFDSESLNNTKLTDKIVRQNGSKTILFDISKHFATTFTQNCDGISQQV